MIKTQDCSLGRLPAASVGPWDVDSCPCWGPACSHRLQMNELFIINKENGKEEKKECSAGLHQKIFVHLQSLLIWWVLRDVCVCWIWYSDIIVVLIKNAYSTTIYLLIISCGTPLVYYLGIEENRRLAQAHFRDHVKMFKKSKNNKEGKVEENKRGTLF